MGTQASGPLGPGGPDARNPAVAVLLLDSGTTSAMGRVMKRLKFATTSAAPHGMSGPSGRCAASLAARVFNHVGGTISAQLLLILS